MADSGDFTHHAPAQPIVLKPHHHPAPRGRGRRHRRNGPHEHLTRRRVVYLVGLTLQAAVLGAVVALGVVYEAPIRAALGGADDDAAATARMDGLDGRIDTLQRQVDAVAAAILGAPSAATATDATPAGAAAATVGASDGLAARIEAVERIVTEVAAKLDDVRDAQLFPTQDSAR